MVVVVATALLLITYSRLISRYLLLFLRRYRRRRGRRRRSYLPNSPPSTNGAGDYLDSPPPLFDSPDGFHHIYAGASPYGLDESVIKTIPISLYSSGSSFRKLPSPTAAAASCRDCAVCLLEFEDGDYVRKLPVCSHAFHVDCIDIWLRSHANCPLCRARIFLRPPEFVPLMAARIRPSLVDDTNLFLLRNHNNNNDDTIISSPTTVASRTEPAGRMRESPPPRQLSEITPCAEEEGIRDCNLEDRGDAVDGGGGGSSSSNNFIRLKRSYSFGFERSERMLVTEPATVSPWRSSRRSSAWSKRPSPFGSYLSNSSKHRLFSSFRYYYRSGIKSPFFRRRSGGGGGFFPLSERFPAHHHHHGGGGSSRRSKSMTSPMFLRPSSVFSSSRLRCGDPEALISPDRFSHSMR
ncbi:unnamed protein product [Linum tenue]|uniref:RING-type E3 ubiquitin transferase n=1 Tax=Linum tenue TaxID=586396 RepID=A0AAV0JA56_9ROSI|nr:unnamed protein product [Linum tenue]